MFRRKYFTILIKKKRNQRNNVLKEKTPNYYIINRFKVIPGSYFAAAEPQLLHVHVQRTLNKYFFQKDVRHIVSIVSIIK